MTINPIVIIILLSLYGCASQPLAVSSCPKAAPLTPEMRVPAPAPQMFQKCLREIVAVGEGRGPISPGCSNFLQVKATP